MDPGRTDPGRPVPAPESPPEPGPDLAPEAGPEAGPEFGAPRPGEEAGTGRLPWPKAVLLIGILSALGWGLIALARWAFWR